MHPLYKEPEWTIYGPYQRKEDLRRHVIAYNGNQRITISYPKYLMECHLQRLLTNDEEVHHINTIEFDDRIDNFEIRNSIEHRKEHHLQLPEFFICPICQIQFRIGGKKLSELKSNRKRRPNMKGPYCSRSCAGKDK